ncbi:MAG: hypothetical protein KGO94_06885 [Alphaproteobacteria bacterium]|nr:hypothetical protein [Alphaproteobacteria bacterium]
MFGNLFSKSSATQSNHIDLTKANLALAERLDHMVRVNSISERVSKIEVKTPELVKKPTSIILKNPSILRRSFVATV